MSRDVELEQNFSGQAFEAGLEAGLEGLKPVEIEAKQYDKEVTLFCLKTEEKAGAKMSLRLFLTPFLHVSFARGSKTGPWTDFFRCLLRMSSFKSRQAPSSAALFQCRNASNQSELATRLEQGTSALYLLVLV